MHDVLDLHKQRIPWNNAYNIHTYNFYMFICKICPVPDSSRVYRESLLAVSVPLRVEIIKPTSTCLWTELKCLQKEPLSTLRLRWKETPASRVFKFSWRQCRFSVFSRFLRRGFVCRYIYKSAFSLNTIISHRTKHNNKTKILLNWLSRYLHKIKFWG